jgi:hypothetical protein
MLSALLQAFGSRGRQQLPRTSSYVDLTVSSLAALERNGGDRNPGHKISYYRWDVANYRARFTTPFRSLRCSVTFIDDNGHGNPISFARSHNKGIVNVAVRIDLDRT